MAARLSDEPAFGFGLARDRLLIGDLRPADVRFDAELAHEPVGDDLEVPIPEMIVWPVSSS